MYSLLLLEFVINILDFNFLPLNLQKPNCQISFFATTDGKNGFFHEMLSLFGEPPKISRKTEGKSQEINSQNIFCDRSKEILCKYKVSS